MDWHQHIHSSPDVLLGKPVVKGTRISVEFLLGLAAAGWSQQQILDNYPGLTSESLAAAFSYARDALGELSFHTLTAREP